jgi:hypothetical protein
MHRWPRKIAVRFYALVLLACVLTGVTLAQTIAPVITVDHGPNAPQQLSKPYVILVSLDGFRYDYPQPTMPRICSRWLLVAPARQTG